MGILDSGLCLTRGQSANKVNHFVAQVDIVDENVMTGAIDCANYNTMQIVASSTIANSQLAVIGYYNDTSYSRYQGAIPVIDITDFTPKILSPFTVTTGITHTYVIDVSRFSKIKIGKTTAAGSCTLSYSLDQTMRGLKMLHEINLGILQSKTYATKKSVSQVVGLLNNRIDVLLPSANKIDCADYNTLQLEITISGAVELDLFGWLTNTGISTASPLDVYEKTANGLIKLTNYTLSVNGLHILFVDVSMFSQFGIGKKNATGTLNLSYKLLQDSLSVSEIKSLRDYYYQDRTTPVGDAKLFEIPQQYRSGRIIVNSKNGDSTITLRYTPRGYSMANALANSRYFDRVVTSDRQTVNTKGVIAVVQGITSFYFDASACASFNGGIGSTSGIDIFIELSTEPLPNDVLALLYPTSVINANLKSLVANNDIEISYYDDSTMNLKSVKENLAVWASSNSLYISTSGLGGAKKQIVLNADNFPNLITGSSILQAQFVYWSRNATTGFAGKDWRLIVITDKGQIYHNYPSRSSTADGTAIAGDEYLFDESCVWELETRKTPVKTNTGDDLTLINTGKYYYNPMLPDIAYTMHPAINQDNGYGNGGFPASVTKVNEKGENVTFGRFFYPNRDNVFCNPFYFMGGFETNEKMTVLGTYRDNNSIGSRICLFITNDGGRNWFCRYEMGANGRLINTTSTGILTPLANWTYALKVLGIPAASSGQYAIERRLQYTPSAVGKEPPQKFKYETIAPIASIAANTDNIRVTTSSPHLLDNGDIIVFKKLAGGDWDFLVNDDCTDMVGGSQIFKIKQVDATSFDLMDCPHNPENNLCCRHMHSINKCKDGYMLGYGEGYPNGWIFYLSVIQSDSFARFYPWDTLNLVRINSTPEAIQRPLGVILRQDKDNTIIIGVDNEYTPLPTISLPEGRTDTFKRSSNGVFKGKLIDADNQGLYECIFESPEVCYFFKEILGAMIYIGQQGHIGISLDGGTSWHQAKLPKTFRGVFENYGGMTVNKEIVINNLIIKVK